MAKCYMEKVEQNEFLLHYRRSPSFRSLLVFIMIVLFGWFVALSTVNKWLQFSIVAIAIYFAYISTEKYEECILNKRKGTVTLCSARLVERIILGYRKLIVSELSQIAGVEVTTFTSKYTRSSHQVCLKFIDGFSLSLTASCTYEDKRECEFCM
ncbi:cytochrome b-245 chaperone 1 homolog isoform X2 [Dysidea avara]|uniref:cytochrome b-245 chaperone 1 homolog isoform X2 n=1 Tax=Dysidea avara TaxID=196820 RepID=UPI00332FCFB2